VLDTGEAQRSGVAETLFGRGRELQLIAAYLRRASLDGETLVLHGEPGVGKTALLDAAADAALKGGSLVLRAAGAEFEADLTFSALHQILDPLRERFTQLNDAHRAALNVALGYGDDAAPDRLVVSNATLTLLRHEARTRPLLMIIDDLPWVDRASALVLGFVARRLAGSSIGLLAVLRSGDESFFERAGLPQHELEPLDDQAASALLDARFPAVAPTVRQRVLLEARGNPLALLELPLALRASERAEPAGLPEVLPLTRRLEALFASRVPPLPARTRELLLLAALEGTGDPRVLHADGLRGSADLAAAERDRLVRLDGHTGRLDFRHPLIRSTVVGLSTTDQLRRAHKELARLFADQPDRQARHLAAATIEPDEHVAILLEQTAARILRRGDAVGAVSALTRASELSPLGADRARRLTEAAYIGANMTGDIRKLPQLLAAAQQADPEVSASLETAAAATYVLTNADVDIDTAHRLLVGAIESHTSQDNPNGVGLEEALQTLLRVCWVAGRAEPWQPFHHAVARLASNISPTLSLADKTVADPVRTAAPVLGELDHAIDDLSDEIDPIRIERIAFAAMFVDRLGPCRQPLWRNVRNGRERGAAASVIKALIQLARDDLATGQWDEARQLAHEAIELSDTHGYWSLAWHARQVQAALAAARGDYETTESLAAAMIQWAAPRRVRVMQYYAWHALALASLGRGEFEEAYQHASAISCAGTLASHVPHALWVIMDLVEAAVRTGRHPEAAAHVAAVREADVAALSPRLALVTGASAAIAAADSNAIGRFEEALAIPGIDRWPFDLARVQLAYGERLRRAHTARQSRLHLTAAIQTFERLGARPWADRAAGELRATGQTKPRRHPQDRDSLTPQELEVATLAASGLTNKQIGQRLFLSHRTISGHLHRTFPKLGITSRAALRDALASLPPTKPDGEHTPKQARR
jgi:DNA-binding CsgD family transcriptional regulator